MQILYMHGNKINKKSDLKCLAKLPSLQKVTLHGNPIAEHPDLRHFVSAQVPHLRSLNFGCITRLEWQDIETWRRGKPALPLVK
jgi:Leucine-rich repeat (LRR) protein